MKVSIWLLVMWWEDVGGTKGVWQAGVLRDCPFPAGTICQRYLLRFSLARKRKIASFFHSILYNYYRDFQKLRESRDIFAVWSPAKIVTPTYTSTTKRGTVLKGKQKGCLCLKCPIQQMCFVGVPSFLRGIIQFTCWEHFYLICGKW